MATVDIDGTTIAYEIVGDGGPPWVITPGGRFSKDVPGIRDLAEAIAAHGQRVIIWDRPNTGASDVCFDGDSESAMQADKLAGLLRSLDLAPAVVVGGSGGARVSLLTATRHPDVVSKLAMLWISGGVYGLMLLGVHYCGESIRVAWRNGMEAVVELPEWAEVLERNPGNRARFLALDPGEFVATLERWMLVYCPDERATVPGVTDDELARLDVPTLVFRSGTRDPHHTRATSERVAALIPGAQLVEPPWGDDEWNERGDAAREGRGALFERWPLLAPQLLDFSRR
ncbi:MAG TPA: alpha/beta hydrolase [Acidimicrobiia bacterium]|nr:alpha/beta hydrolase [Acidimicrobiia bacterium]